MVLLPFCKYQIEIFKLKSNKVFSKWILSIFIYLFYRCVEKFVRIYSGAGHSHSHGHSHSASDDVAVDSKDDEKKDKKLEKEPKSDSKGADDDNDKEADDDDDNTETGSDHENEAVNNSIDSEEQNEDIQVSGYLNLAADAFHNFTDGLAIGASFLAGDAVGWTTTLTILFHEIPHEVGDYAILIQAGVSRKKAMFLQLLTAVAAMVGCIVALVAKEAGDAVASGFILPFTAGGFIYIATVSVIPELLEGSSFKQSIYEIIALLVGVYMMVIITWYE